LELPYLYLTAENTEVMKKGFFSLIFAKCAQEFLRAGVIFDS
jgi:hypothetical protein